MACSCFILSCIRSGALQQAFDMRLKLRACLLIFVFSLVSFPIFAETAKLLVVSPDLPGAAEQGGQGRDAEIVRQVLKLCGYDSQFVVQPFGRHIRTYNEKTGYDAVMTVPLQVDLDGASTAAYIWYQNGAYYDVTRVDPIRSVRDLSGLHLVTFKDGIRLLDLNNLVPDAASILEIADQRVHSKLLFLKRVDVILADGLIVAEVNRRLLDNDDTSRKSAVGSSLRFSPIFPPSPYKMVFRNEALAKDFDKCFEGATEGHLIHDINQKYLKPFQHELRHRYLGQ